MVVKVYATFIEVRLTSINRSDFSSLCVVRRSEEVQCVHKIFKYLYSSVVLCKVLYHTAPS